MQPIIVLETNLIISLCILKLGIGVLTKRNEYEPTNVWNKQFGRWFIGLQLGFQVAKIDKKCYFLIVAILILILLILIIGW